MTSIDSISQALRTGAGQTAATGNRQASGAGNDVFGDMFHSAAQQVSKLDNDAQSAVTGLLNGQGVEVHDAMIATQKSELAFELALQVRNKAVSAYQQMMGMQF